MSHSPAPPPETPVVATGAGTHPMPVLALVGRPNVGKSTLFNRLTRSRNALVAPIPGVTRDRREQVTRFEEFRFRLVDTGGVSFSEESDFSAEIAAQVDTAIRTADIVWLILDGAEGLNPYDAELFRALQKQGKPVVVVANKADSPARLQASAEFYALGSDRVYPISALHGTGVREALAGSAALLSSLRTAEQSAERNDFQAIRVAFVGKPNAGKSSLVNRILGNERQIVSDIAGTTREAVEIPFKMFDQDYVLVDTAGIRRRARTKEYLEKISVLNALTAMDKADVVVVVLDASEPSAEQDARITGYVLEKGRGLVIAMNKWDVVRDSGVNAKDVEADIAHTLRFVEFAPRVRISAVSGEGLERLFKDIAIVGREFAREIQTADLNRVLQVVTRQTPPPAKGKSSSRILYGTQTSTRPPSFRFFANHPESIPDSYTRYMEHQLRYHFGFRGVPVGVEWRGRDGMEAAPGTRLHPSGKRPGIKSAKAHLGHPQRKARPKPGTKGPRSAKPPNQPAAKRGKARG
jgi:GTP-binding protein